MAEVEPLPPGLLSQGVESFIRELGAVESVTVTDRSGERTYAPPAQNGHESASEPEPPVIVPTWGESARAGNQATPGVPQAPEAGPAVQPQAPQVLTFSQPLMPEIPQVDPAQGRDLTLEERVEWLEERLTELTQRLNEGQGS